jgi:hypothetical protein
MADEDDRPSIAELSAIYRDDGKRCLAITEAVPVLLDIAAAALEWKREPRTQQCEALIAALAKVRP